MRLEEIAREELAAKQLRQIEEAREQRLKSYTDDFGPAILIAIKPKIDELIVPMLATISEALSTFKLVVAGSSQQ